jgi:hypothetical protein
MQEGVGALLLGGWELSGSFNARTGRPFTVTQSGDPLALGSLSTTLPDLVGDPEIDDQTVDRWFNPSAFRLLTATTNRFGTLGRNTLRGPNFAALDVSIHRRFGLGAETRYIDFRWEVQRAQPRQLRTAEPQHRRLEHRHNHDVNRRPARDAVRAPFEFLDLT